MRLSKIRSWPFVYWSLFNTFWKYKLSLKVYYMAKKTGLDEIQAKLYKVKTLRARKHIHNTFEPGAPSRHETLPWQFCYFTCENKN